MKDHDWQLTNLELSKRLKELGVKQKSVWWWHIHPESDSYFIDKEHLGSPDGMSSPICSAFTVAELGLPKGYTSIKTDKGWTCVNIVDTIAILQDRVIGYSDTEANARAKMRIHLLEKGKING